MTLKKISFNILLMIFMIVIVLTILEIGFRVYSNYTLIYDVEMHKYATKLKQRSSINGLTHEHIPNSEAELMGVNIKLNNLGFREDINTNKKQINEKRIIIVGSSITMGWGVPYDSIFSSKLERYLSNNSEDKDINVINTGIGNYNTVLESRFIEHNIDNLNPDELILHFYLNDVEILGSGSQNIFIKYFYSIAYFYIRIKQAIHSNKNKYKSMGEYYADLYKDESEGWLAAKKAIISVKKICESRGVRFMVLIQPDLHDLSELSFQKECHKKINTFLSDNSIKYHDLFKSFQEKAGNDPQKIWVNNDDPHPNIKGHDIIYSSLINNVYK